MKKRVFTAIFMFFFSITLCLLSFLLTRYIYDDIIISLDKTEKYIFVNDTDSAKKTASEISDKWSFQQNIFSLFINHEKLQNAELALSSIEKYLSIDDLTGTLMLCEDAKICIKQIYEAELPSFWNIF